MPPTRIGCRRLRLLVPVLGCVIVVRLGTTWPARPTSGALALVALRFDAILGAMTTIGIAGTRALLANIWLRGRTPTADCVITIARFAYCGTASKRHLSATRRIWLQGLPNDNPSNVVL